MNKKDELKGLFSKWLENNKGKVSIHFYEWSDANRIPMDFNTINEFRKFCDKCNIKTGQWVDCTIWRMGNCHIACKPGKPELIIMASKELLIKALAHA